MKFTPRTYAQAFVSAAHGAKSTEVKTLSANLWHMVARRRHLSWAKRIIAEISTLAQAQTGVQVVEVAVAHEATPAFKRTLEGGLTRALGGEVAVTYQIKPHLMAGAVVTIGDKRYDASLKGRLDALYTTLAGETPHTN